MPRPPAAHGTTNRWRRGCRCSQCSAAHITTTTADRRAVRLAELRPYRTKILRRLATGRSIEDAVLDTPLTPERLYGLARWNEAWRTAFDAAMLAGRHPGIAHGTEQGYRHDRCRCPECRAAHGH